MSTVVAKMDDRSGGAPSRSSWAQIRAWLEHAFSLAPEHGELSAGDLKLLDSVACAVRKRGLITPAVMWLESVKPLHFLGSQALVFLSPLAHTVLTKKKYDCFVRILARRDGIETLLRRIERIDEGGAA